MDQYITVQAPRLSVSFSAPHIRPIGNLKADLASDSTMQFYIHRLTRVPYLTDIANNNLERSVTIIVAAYQNALDCTIACIKYQGSCIAVTSTWSNV